MSGRMNWSRRYRPSQSIRHDDADDAASKWLAQHDHQNVRGGKSSNDDGITWGPWRPFKRASTEGWERDGTRMV
jgi:hypothetical protein